MIDAEKVLKLLNLGSSPNDNEALSALRMANGMLAKHNLDWISFFNKNPQKSSVREEEETHEGPTYKDEIEKMLNSCLSCLSGSAHEFITSLSVFFKTRGFLTEKQEQALYKFYINCEKNGFRKYGNN